MLPFWITTGVYFYGILLLQGDQTISNTQTHTRDLSPPAVVELFPGVVKISENNAKIYVVPEFSALFTQLHALSV